MVVLFSCWTQDDFFVEFSFNYSMLKLEFWFNCNRDLIFVQSKFQTNSKLFEFHHIYDNFWQIYYFSKPPILMVNTMIMIVKLWVTYIFSERCVIIQNKVESKAKLAAAAKQQFYGIVVIQCKDISVHVASFVSQRSHYQHWNSRKLSSRGGLNVRGHHNGRPRKCR